MGAVVRAKFTCLNKTENTVHFQVVHSGSEENEQFWKYTPAGEIHMHIDNEQARDRFEEGKQYYVDFTPAE
jgi:hypothetical protein